MKEPIIRMIDVSKKFDDRIVFDKFNMEIFPGEFVTITGKSGSGKSTLLNMIGLLDTSDKGTIELFKESNVKAFSSKATKILRNKIGYLFQNFALVQNESVLYNMRIAIKHYKLANQNELIKEALNSVGLSGYEDKKIYHCSEGEQQRIAIARLLIKPCDLILADEPTASLDAENKDEILRLLKIMNREGKTIIIVTHDLSLLDISDRNIHID